MVSVWYQSNLPGVKVMRSGSASASSRPFHAKGTLTWAVTLAEGLKASDTCARRRRQGRRAAASVAARLLWGPLLSSQ